MPLLMLLWRGASAAPPVQDTATGDTAWYQETSETSDTGGTTLPTETAHTGGGSGGSGGSGGTGDTGATPTDGTDVNTDATDATDANTDDPIDTGGEEDKEPNTCGCDIPGAPAGAALGLGWAAALVVRGRRSEQQKNTEN